MQPFKVACIVACVVVSKGQGNTSLLEKSPFGLSLEAVIDVELADQQGKGNFHQVSIVVQYVVFILNVVVFHQWAFMLKES